MIPEYVIEGLEDAEDLRLETFLEEHGMNDDLIVQCVDTQQVMTLRLSQMYEVLASSEYASMSQRLLAEAQVTVGSALESHLPANNPSGNRPQEQPERPLDQCGHTAAYAQNPPRWHPSLQSVNSFHGTRDQSIQPLQQPPQAQLSLRMAGSTQQDMSSQQRLTFHELMANDFTEGAKQLPQQSRRRSTGSEQQPTKRPKKVLSDADKEKLRALPDDGFRWRKYGEKTLHSETGEVTIKSYFRCCHATCAMRKQVTTGFEDSHTRLIGDGHTHEVLGLTCDVFLPDKHTDKTSIENTSAIVNTIKVTDVYK